jgi:hypothetical protein
VANYDPARGTNQEMLDYIAAEIRYIRDKLDHHIEDETDNQRKVRDEITKLKEELAEHKTKVGIMSSGLAVAITAGLTWFMNMLKGQ